MTTRTCEVPSSSSWMTVPCVPQILLSRSFHLRSGCPSIAGRSTSREEMTTFLPLSSTSVRTHVGSQATILNGGKKRTFEVPSDTSSPKTRPRFPQTSVKRSFHFSAALASMAARSSSTGPTKTFRRGHRLYMPCAWASAMSRGSPSSMASNCSCGISWLGGSSPACCSNHCLNQATRSALPEANSAGGPLPKTESSAWLPTGSSFCAASYRNSTACSSVSPTCSAMAAYAFRKPACLGASKGPGMSSLSSPPASPPPSATIIQDKLSFEPLCKAFLQTDTAAAAKSGVSPLAFKSFAARRTTSLLGKSPSEMPSQTSMRKSVGSHLMVVNSGAADTG
mmetsp:Transcript_44226/g.117184  ORF Transcript_44226/g.117184 Transcript_44226/m.117184 type:complete len:338 (+) Transcript_44226:621-1634(+)